MKTNSRVCRRRREASVELILLSLLALARESKAQSVLIPAPSIPVTPPAMQEFQTNEISYLPSPDENEISRMKPLLQLGPVQLRPHLFYSAVYGNGIQSGPGEQHTTLVQQFSPGILFEIGSHWTLDYTPTWSFYSDSHFRDTLDHNVQLTAGTTYEDWIFGFSQNYLATSAPLVETGTQTDRESFGTALTASYRFNSKISTDLAVNQTVVSTEDFTSYREWSTLDWLNYQFWPRLNVAVGGGFGFVDEDAGADSSYEQLQGRINWRATDKVSLQLHAGFEDRQFLDGGAEDLINPIFGVSIRYEPVSTTLLSLTAERTVTPAYFQNQVQESTTVSASLEQRLFEKFHLGLGGGYTRASYSSSAASASSRAANDYYFFSARLGYSVLQRGSVALTYQFNENSSGEPGYSFSSNQIGVELGYQF
ncbi:MAG TPA: outer membrane beta-barrel protein [Verrucomicrobiae bacterium]|nr:outer membrane beta-barrel protein [Verrucomicrobiae bacterium]